MRFLLDAQLSPKLVAALRKARHQAEHVFELGMTRTPDAEIWRHAESIGAVIVSKDSDFATMRLHAQNSPAVIWLRLGNVTTGVLQKTLLAALPEIIAALANDEVLIEIR